MPDETIVNIPGKTVRKVANLFCGMGVEHPKLAAIRQIGQAKSSPDQAYLPLLNEDYEALCVYLRSTLENSSFSEQNRNTAAFILTCLKCNEYKLPYFSLPETSWLDFLQPTPQKDDKEKAPKLFKAFVHLPASRNARDNLTISDALQSNIFWSLLSYLPIIRNMQENFMSLYHDDIPNLIQTSLADGATRWPDNLPEILDIYFKHSSPKNKTTAAYAIWQHIDRI